VQAVLFNVAIFFSSIGKFNEKILRCMVPSLKRGLYGTMAVSQNLEMDKLFFGI
jgi:hypothetical protein